MEAGYMVHGRSLPREGIKVLDLTRVRAGPTATRQLVHWGAEVIKIESPASISEGNDMGGPRNGSDFQNLNGGKLSLTLNLKEQAGLDIFLRLARKADVVIENYRPDVKQKLGIDYEALKQDNPGLVYTSISGFGQDGPYCKRPGFDQIVQGMSGLMSVNGLPGTPYVRTGIAVADSVTGQMAAQGVLLALLERHRSGKGQWVQVSLLETLINLLDFQAVRYLNEGEVPVQVGNDHATRMPTGAYKTADGSITICAAADRMWRKLCIEIGREDMLTHPDFSDQAGRSSNRERLNEELESALSTRSTTEWVERLNKVGVACGPIYRIDQMFEDDQVGHLNLVRQVKHKELGSLNVLAQPIRLSESSPTDARPAPILGEHVVQVLAGMGFSEEEISSLRQQKIV
jgi:formyl-CoA transferase